MLRLQDIRVTVPDGEDTLDILAGADLKVERGEIVSISGRSGSGKSTLLAVAGLLRRPDAGTLTIDGIDTSQLSNRERSRVRSEEIGVVHQSAELFPSLTAVQQLEVVAHIRGALDRTTRGRARSLLDEVGLERRHDSRPARLSGGERQRVGIARALMNEPSILLADEPTSALDAERGRQIMELLASEARKLGLATVIVTHDAAHLDLCDRAYRLEGGRLRDG